MRRRRHRKTSRTLLAAVLMGAAVIAFLHLHKSAKADAETTPAIDHGGQVASSVAVPSAPPSVTLSAPSSQPALLADAKTKIAAGDLLPARAMLNDALSSLSTADAATAKQLLTTVNQTIVFSTTRFSDDPFGGLYTVQKGDSLAKIAANYAITPDFLSHINHITDPRKIRLGATLKVIKGPFHAVVTKSAFTMDIYLGKPGEKTGMYIASLPVGLGRDDSTPTGVWMCAPHEKLKNPTYFSPRGEGVIAASDPKNPLGGYWIGIVGVDGQAVGAKSYGVHGTIDPDSIGKQSSMGCIRLRHDDIALVYDLLVEAKSTVSVRE